MPSQAPSSSATILGANIKLARGARDLTQRQLAALLDVESGLVSKWERGWHRPSEENLQALAREFEHDIAWFYTDHSVPDPSDTEVAA